MSNNNGAKGKVCRYCRWVWDHQGKRFAQTYDFTSWVNDGYKPIVCEKCQSARAGEGQGLRKQGKVDQGIKVVQPPSKEQVEQSIEALQPPCVDQGSKVLQKPSKEQLDREYGRVRAIIRLGSVPDGARGFASYGIIRFRA